ncbi:GIY-YIG nuclease family protein [Oscillatoriales cyanobacterium LEGE 11467]|uniref:GIY-YIG nuclease family protein n=1 Tax=Zarconia navalis LEGE 11467 TaxID=1828826 RepID=A0A928Z8U4_9CYAN|nr:GIY-YIG nuclease family protein [Zarconia navalis]MBE9040974.1 GIY-YIG nuclease family protein [Zarconia navalis LEGE 11467]
MTTQTQILTLSDLEYVPYLDDSGCILEDPFQRKVGVYAIFDANKVLQFIGYSRDIYLSLKQHLIRQPQQCHWVKCQTIDRPNRTILENIQNAWIAENGSTPSGNGADVVQWTQPIDVKPLMSAEERESLARVAGEDLPKIKLLKKISRRVEAEILAELEQRGVKMQLRFNPKLKETGLLDLKS